MGCSGDEKEDDKEKGFRNEVYVGGPKGIPLINYTESSKAVCKIIIDNKNKVTGTGFFLQDSYKNYFLITNYHVISKTTVEEKKIIEIEIHDGKIFELNLQLMKKHIQFFENPLDITTIQINDFKELYQKVKFLEVDGDYMNHKNKYGVYKNNDVFALGYPLGKDLVPSPGKIKKIIGEEFKHNCHTDYGSSGSPIILVSTMNVIGIHKAGNEKEKINKGTFIEAISESIEDNKSNSRNKKISNSNPKNNQDNNYSTNQSQNRFRPTNATTLKRSTAPKSNNDPNFITAYFEINEKEKSENIRIINSYEANNRSHKIFQLDKELQNEEDIKQCNIEIEDKVEMKFTYTYKFNEAGKFKVIYYFQKKLKNLLCMFNKCKNLISIDLSNFKTKDVTNMKGMFCDCSKLTDIDLDNLNTYKVIDMSYMFCRCLSSKVLDFSNLDTSHVLVMSNMFSCCKNLTDLNLSNLNNNKLIDMSYMFSDCEKLTDLNLSNFKTPEVTNMSYMFFNCSLKSINLLSFDTKNVRNMSYMFYNCSLKSIDLSNFNAKNVTDMSYMFSLCRNLTFINLSNFETKNEIDMSYMFSDCFSLSNLDISKFTIKKNHKPENYNKMFSGCKNLLLDNIICTDQNLLALFSIQNN